MKQYIFLDIDGVINTDRHCAQLARNRQPLRDELGPFYDPVAISNLKRIVESTEAEIVITSSWRFKGWDVMQQAWCRRGMPGILVGLTPSITHSYYCIRGMEILRWLAENEAEEDVRYVIIDDCDDFLPEQRALLVRTNPQVGITEADAQRAIDILNNNSPAAALY